MNKKRDIYQEVTDKIVEKMESGKLSWQHAWDGKIGTALTARPQNAVTGKPYHEANAFYLSVVAADIGDGKDPRFCSFNDAGKNGWTVRKGSKGFPIKHGFLATKDRHGIPLAEEDYHWASTYSVVFHASQLCMVKDDEIVDIPPYEYNEIKGYTHEETIQLAENMLNKSKAVIINDQADKAFYRRNTDEIHLPPREAFPDITGYYAVALHELGHWTGHENRLNRDIINNYAIGSEEAAKEELRAEMASAFLSMETGIPFNPTNHAAYTQGWLACLKNDKMEFFKAAKDAEKITEYVLSLVQDREHIYLTDDKKDTISIEPILKSDTTLKISDKSAETVLTDTEKTFIQGLKKRCSAIENEVNKTTLQERYRFYVKNERLAKGSPWRIADQNTAKKLLNFGYSTSKVQTVIQENSPEIWSNIDKCYENKNYGKSVIDSVMKDRHFAAVNSR